MLAKTIATRHSHKVMDPEMPDTGAGRPMSCGPNPAESADTIRAEGRGSTLRRLWEA